MSVLAGDFLLGRSSVQLARLNDLRLLDLISTIIAHLVEGEFMQLERRGELDEGAMDTAEKAAVPFEKYIRKSFLKTASLLGNTARGVAVIGGKAVAARYEDACFRYGTHVGLALQVADDVLDFTASEKAMGKPVGADLKAGILTAPVLYALQGPQGARLARLLREGDSAEAAEVVKGSDGLVRARALALFHENAAVEALDELPAGPARDALRQFPSLLTRQLDDLAAGAPAL